MKTSPNHPSFKHRKRRFFAFILIFIVVLAVVVISILWVKNSTNNLLDTYSKYLSVYTQNLQQLTFSPINNVISMLLPYMNFEPFLSDDQIKDIFNQLETGNNHVRLWMVRNDNSIVLPYDTDQRYLEDHPWWKAFAENKDTSHVLMGKASFSYIVATAYRDSMKLSTILPIVAKNVSADGQVTFIFMEFNLSEILQEKLNYYSVQLGGLHEQIEIIVYDQHGTALETTRNLPIKHVEVPIPGAEETAYGSLNFSGIQLFGRNNDAVAFFSRDISLNIVFCGIIQTKDIYAQAREDFLVILLISALFVFVFLLLFGMNIKANKEVRMMENLQEELRFQTLQSKMNPHFLFNVLDSMVSVTESGNKEETLAMLQALSFLLHVDLRENRNAIPLAEETKYIRSYIALQENRYHGLFSFSLDIDKSVPPECRILKYCIQPLVENSFVHGVYQRVGFIHIQIHIFVKKNHLNITVIDDGPGCSREKWKEIHDALASPKEIQPQSTEIHIGLMSIKQRIAYAYGKPYGIHLIEVKKRFCVALTLPLILDDAVKDLQQRPPHL